MHHWGKYLIVVFMLPFQMSGQDMPEKQLVAGLSDAEAVEYAPSISADGRTIVFESNLNGDYQLFESHKGEDGNWMTPLPIDPINNFEKNTKLIGGPSLSFDGNTLFFFAAYGTGKNSDIYYSVRTENGWSEPINIGEPINSEGYEAFPSISADGKTLYFVKANQDGPQDKELKKDDIFCTSIFKSEKRSDGQWSAPVKLPPPINKDCEKAPKIMADGRTLIFSSNRPGGKGDYDMYQSKQDLLGEWGKIEALDFVNTDKSDQLPSISASGELMYFVYDNKDIYTVEIPYFLRQFTNNVITGTVKDVDSGIGVGAKIVIYNALTSEEVARLDNNPENGAFSLVLPVGNSYNLLVEKPGYSSFVKSYDLRMEGKYREFVEEIFIFNSIEYNLIIGDEEKFELIPANIVVENFKGQIIQELKSTEFDGLAQLTLPIGDRYKISIERENYHPELKMMDVTGMVMYRKFTADVDLKPLKSRVIFNVLDEKTNEPIESEIFIVSNNSDQSYQINGNESLNLRVGEIYEIETTSGKGYAFNSTVFEVNRKDSVQNMDIRLLKLEPGALLTLREILFESNSSQLSEISYAELNRVIQLMKENPSLKVEVAAHTDDVGSSSYNRVLSEKRAESVVQYLIENQISAERFESKGYGEAAPRVANDSEENRSINRRVELKILEI